MGRPRFTELEAARLLRPLLESVAYLHDLGGCCVVVGVLWCCGVAFGGLMGMCKEYDLTRYSGVSNLFEGHCSGESI